MKLILKERQVYDKINIIVDLISYIENNYHINFTFDNRETNHYKLIVYNKTFEFNGYDGVINSLKLLINIKEEEEI